MSVQGDGRNGDETKEAVGATTAKKRQKQDNLGSDVMSHPIVDANKKKVSRAEVA